MRAAGPGCYPGRIVRRLARADLESGISIAGAITCLDACGNVAPVKDNYDAICAPIGDDDLTDALAVVQVQRAMERADSGHACADGGDSSALKDLL